MGRMFRAGGSAYWNDRNSFVAPAGGDSRAISFRASVSFDSSVTVTVQRVRGAKSPALPPSHAPLVNPRQPSTSPTAETRQHTPALPVQRGHNAYDTGNKVLRTS